MGTHGIAYIYFGWYQDDEIWLCLPAEFYRLYCNLLWLASKAYEKNLPNNLAN